MAEIKRLGPWGWFVRAFAAGFGATFGVVVASVLAIAACYALIAAGVPSLGGVNSQTSGTSTPPTLAPTTIPAPSYPTRVEPSPYVAGPNVGSNPYPTYPAEGRPSYASGYGNSTTGEAHTYGNSTTGEPGTYGNSTTAEPATNASSPTGEASNEPPIFNAQPAPPVISIPSEPAPAPEGASAPLP